MLDAIFSRTSREAAIDGAYQYDTGQRLRLSGLPSPEEMTEADDMLAGDLPAVQVQYGYVGDSQTEMRLAQWDEDRWCWMADIPDAYLTRHEAVHVYVYVSYGGGRNKTAYEGVFTPISRPAPDNMVTDEQINRWETLENEVELALVSAQTAADKAEQAALDTEAAARDAANATETATAAAKSAQEADDRLDAVDARWAAMKASASTPAAIGNAAAAFSGSTNIKLTLPRGYTGAAGATGATGPADITLSFSGGVLTITPK